MSGHSLRRSPRSDREGEVARHVARRVRDLRLQSAVTQEELAEALGVKRESMSRYESGERAITIALLLDIAAALGRPISALLPDGDPPTGDATDAIVATLRARPDLIPSVQDLLAALMEGNEG